MSQPALARRGPSLAIAIAFAVTLSIQPAAADGINLSWDECGASGIPIKTFACTSNVGSSSAIASFIPPSGIDQFNGLEAEIDVTSQNDLPNWWQHGSNLCRGTTALTVSVDFTSVSACADPWEGQGVSGRAYDVGYGGPNHARLRMFAALPYARTLDSATEYYGFSVRVMNSKATGTGSCDGCSEPVRLSLNSVTIMQPSEAGNNPVLTAPISNAVIHWQNTFGPLPAITTVSPTVGSSGTVVTLTGSGFTPITSVRFDALEAGFTVNSDTEISTTVPPSVILLAAQSDAQP